MRVCLVDNSTNVVGVVQLSDSWTPSDKSWQPPIGLTPVQSPTAGIGWTYTNGQFVAPAPNPTPAPTAAQLRAAAFQAEANRQDLITRLQNATPAQIDTWLAANVTSLPQAITVLSAILKVLATQQLS